MGRVCGKERSRGQGRLSRQCTESSWFLAPGVYFKGLSNCAPLSHIHTYCTHPSTHIHTQSHSPPLLIVWLQSLCILTPHIISTHLPLLYFCCICHFHPLCIFDPLADNDEFPSAVQELAEKVCSAKFLKVMRRECSLY